jgi:urocanate hydratase
MRKERLKGKPSIEADDYYLEDGMYIFTQKYLLRRGHCCQNGCRHCPYGFRKLKK